jgi:hypothetical protein
MKQTGGLAAAILLGGSLLLGFQNCGPGFASMSAVSALGSGASTTPPPTSLSDSIIALTPSMASNADQVSHALSGWQGSSGSPQDLLLPELKFTTSWHMKSLTYGKGNSGFILVNGVYDSLGEHEYRIFKFDGDTAASFASVGGFTLDPAIDVGLISVYSEKVLLLTENLPAGSPTHATRVSYDGGQSWTKTDMTMIPPTAYPTFGAGLRFYLDTDGLIKLQYADSSLGKVFLFTLNAQNAWVPTDSVPAPKSQMTYAETSATESHHATYFSASPVPQTLVFQSFFPTQTRVCSVPVGCNLASTYYHVWSDNVVLTCNIAAMTTVFTSQDGCQSFNKVFSASTGYFYVAPSSDPSVFVASFTTADETLAKYDTSNSLIGENQKMLLPQSLVIDFKAPAATMVKTVLQTDLLDALSQPSYASVLPSESFVLGRKILQLASQAETLKLQNKIVIPPVKLNYSQATTHFTLRDLVAARVAKLENEAQINSRLSLMPSSVRFATKDEKGSIYLIGQSSFSAPYLVQKNGLTEKLIAQFKEDGTISDQVTDVDVHNGRFCVALLRNHYGVGLDQYGIVSTQVVFATGTVGAPGGASVGAALGAATNYEEYELAGGGATEASVDCSNQVGFFTLMDSQKNYTYNRVDLKAKSKTPLPVPATGMYLNFFQDRVRGSTSIAYLLDSPSVSTGFVSDDGGATFRKLTLDYSGFILPTYQFDSHSALIVDGILHLFALEPKNFGSTDPGTPSSVILHDVQTVLASGAVTEQKWTLPGSGHAPVHLNYGYNQTQGQIELSVTEDQAPYPMQKITVHKTTAAGPVLSNLGFHPETFQARFQIDPIWVAGKKIFNF